jgi:hypothetical protein
MSKDSRAAQPKQWKVNSVYERRRDGPKRIEQAYRILIDGTEANHNKTRRSS